MECNTCVDRFKCYTVQMGERPKEVKAIGWETVKRCGMCRESKWVRGSGFGAGDTNVGFCNILKKVVHKESAICDEINFNPMLRFQDDKIRHEIEVELKKKHHRGFPKKYCIHE